MYNGVTSLVQEEDLEMFSCKRRPVTGFRSPEMLQQLYPNKRLLDIDVKRGTDLSLYFS